VAAAAAAAAAGVAAELTGRIDSGTAPSDLLAAAGRRLADAWGRRVVAGEMLVALPDRCVFAAAGPRGERAVVKVDAKPWRSANERLLLECARASGVPVPGVLYADDGPPAILVCEYVDGAELTGDSPDAAWTSAGRVLRRLHAMHPVPGLGAMAEPGDSPRAMLVTKAVAEAAAAAQARLLTPSQAGRIRVMLVTAFSRADPGEPLVLHGDCQPGHFLLTPGNEVAAVLDFGDAAVGDPVWDLAVLTLDDPGRLPAVLAGYRPGPPLHARIAELVGACRLLRYLGELIWLNDHGFETRQHRELLGAASESGSLPPHGLDSGA
jgi:aminoglycoside phosphotransferase